MSERQRASTCQVRERQRATWRWGSGAQPGRCERAPASEHLPSRAPRATWRRGRRRSARSGASSCAIDVRCRGAVVLFVLGALQVALVARDQLAIELGRPRGRTRRLGVGRPERRGEPRPAARVTEPRPDRRVGRASSGEVVARPRALRQPHRRRARRHGDRRRHARGDRSDGLGTTVTTTPRCAQTRIET